MSVVASHIDGYSSVITHGQDGLLVPPKDVNSLADTLITVLKDKSLREELSERARATAESYSWEQVAQRVSDYYNKVFEESR